MEEWSPLENASNCCNDSFCYEDVGYCVPSTIYRKVLGTIIFVVVWPFIVLDIKQFPLGRPAAALLGATLMVVFAVVPQEQVYIILGERGNLQTLFLLVGMMLLSYYYDREGILNYVSLYIFGKKKPFKHVLWKVCVLSAALSAIITNDATCVVLTPLLLAEHVRQGRSKKEYAPLLLGIATSANIGSASTFFGNPQNAFIASNSKGQISLLIFFITTLPAAVIGLVISVFILYLCYFRTVWPKKEKDVVSDLNRPQESVEQTAMEFSSKSPDDVQHQSLAESRRELALSYDQSDDPNKTSRIAEERSALHASMQSGIDIAFHDDGDSSQGFGAIPRVSRQRARNSNRSTRSEQKCTFSETELNVGVTVPSQDYGAISSISGTHQRDRNSTRSIRSETRSPVHETECNNTTVIDKEEQTTPKSRWSIWRKRIFVAWLIFVTVVVVVLLAIPPLPAVGVEFNLGLVPMGAAIATMLVDTILNKKYAFDAMIKVDWTMILLFMGLFVWLAGFQNTLFPNIALDFVRTYMDLNTVEGVIFFTVFVALGSNVLSNVPLVILIVDQLFDFQCGDDKCTGQLAGVLLAWVSTIAGNFTLIGSIANLIVAEKARNVTGYRLGFWEYFKFGLCSTMVVLFVGLPIVYFTGKYVSINI